MLPLLLTLLLASPPLHVAAVVRSGLPPYEDESRLYRLEGAGCLALRVGERLSLQRTGERRRLGRLQVTAIKGDHALARLVEGGEAYPLKGDLAVRYEEALGLPALPTAPPPATPPDLTVKPPLSAPVLAPSRVGHREPIFFLKGSAELSPGGRAKLAAWVKAWGVEGHWLVGCPEGAGWPPSLQEARLEQIRGELKRLGVGRVDLRSQAQEAPGKYDAVFVIQEPW